MGIVASLRAALRLSSTSMRLRGAVVSATALVERLLAPAVAYVLVFQGPLRALFVGAALSVTFSARGAVQRSFTARNEAELYARTVTAVLGADVLRPTLLPDEEARGSLFEGQHRIAALLADILPNLLANLVAAGILTAAVAASQPARVILVAAAALGAGGLSLFLSRRLVHAAQKEAWTTWGSVADGVTDACEGRLELVAAGRDDEFLRRFTLTTQSWGDKERRAGRLAGLLGRLPMVLLAAGVGAAVLADAWWQGMSWSAAVVQASLLASNAPAFIGVARCLQEVVSNEERLRLVSRVLDGPRRAQTGKSEPSSAPTLIEWEGVTFSYDAGARQALRDVSFGWKSGELLALAGSNGSGKSTCLRALLGLAELAAGTVRVDGVSLLDLDAVLWRQSITLLPQRPYLPPRATVRECLRFVDADVADEAMSRALERAGMLHRLADPLAAKVGSLSVGERQRVALAGVLCRPAPLVLLDEPDANLDREGVQLVANLVVELSRERMVLVVAHTPEVLSVAHRVITLDAGAVSSVVDQRRNSHSG